MQSIAKVGDGAMVSARALAKRLNCTLQTVLLAIRQGDLTATKVGKTWAIEEDEKFTRFADRLCRLEAARKKRSATLKWLWRIDPLRFKKPPKKRFKLTAKVTNLILRPLPRNLSTGDESVIICPCCHNWIRYAADITLIREEVKD